MASGTPVLAAAAGTVQQAQWQDPNVTSTGFGLFVSVWHSLYGVTTLYAHLSATTSTAMASSTVARQQLVGYSGGTGDANGAYHLHFQTYDAEETITSTDSYFVDTVDPYGWSGTGTDTWANDIPFGYMWASLAATSSVYNYVSGTIANATSWHSNQIYIIQNSLTIPAGVTLTIPSGVVVKFNNSTAYLQVDGKLDVQGTASSPVYFTSLKDDSVGGDTNDDATATNPGTGQWGYIQLDGGSTTTLQNAIIRYGGHNNNPVFADVYLNGGFLSATSTVIASSTYYGIQVASGTAKLTSSTFIGNGNYGIYANGSGNLTITSSTFAYNGVGSSGSGAGIFYLDSGVTVTSTGSTSTGNGWNGFVMSGLINSSQAWSNTDLPYILSDSIGPVTVSSTKTLTINPGVIVKLTGSTEPLVVNGVLNIPGTSTNPVYFTSLKDDSIGGDTNDDTTSTSPSGGDWGAIQLNAKSTSTIQNAIFRYGGANSSPHYANMYVNGGYLSATSTTFGSSTYYGIQVASGTVKITTSTFVGSGNYGIFEDGLNNLTITTSSFLYNGTAAGFIALQNAPTFTSSGNTATGNGPTGGSNGEGNGFIMQGNMAASQTWVKDIPYILSIGATVPSGKTLTVNAGAVIKSDTGAVPVALTIDGRFDVQGTSSNPVYFTSIDDDSVGGDTNNNGSSVGTVGLWGSIKLDTGSTSTIKNAVISYGGHAGTSAYADVYVNGGYLSATSTAFASSAYEGIKMASGTVKITTSTFKGNDDFGFYIDNIGNFTVTTSTFLGNGTDNGAGFLAPSNGPTFTSSGNTSTGSTRNGITVYGQLGVNSTWTNDLVYVIWTGSSFDIPAGKTLTMNPGTVVKFDGNATGLTVDGTLNVIGTTSTNPIYFTSFADDVKGDTNNDGTTTSPLDGDWGSIQTDGGSSSTINYAVVRYGGHNNSGVAADVYMGGGKLSMWHDTLASSTYYGLQVASGTVTITSSTFQGDGTTGTLAVYNTTNVTSSATAKQNWWSSSAGPWNATGHPTGTTDGVGDYVNFIPWLTSKPL